MKLHRWYRENFESQLMGRYITLGHLSPLLDHYKSQCELSYPGISENGENIPLLKIGNGPKSVLAWSQMHGNETTTTKALFDFLKLLTQEDSFQVEIQRFKAAYTLFIIPILNPDGARKYTRENANGIDLNRDAQNLSQKESQCLRAVYNRVRPELCLNLHDQRSIYGFSNGKPATVSFLSPAVDAERTISESRKIAMAEIVKMNAALQRHIPGQVGRYDDSFNEACVGDTFQKLGVPTILFEAGHFRQDYKRERTRELIFYSLLSLFDFSKENKAPEDYLKYFDLPENQVNYSDFILRNAKVDGKAELISVAIQFREKLSGDTISVIPEVMEIGNLKTKYAHWEKDANGQEILTEPQNKLTIGDEVSKIFDKKGKLIVNFQKGISKLNKTL